MIGGGFTVTQDEITPNLRQMEPRLYSAIYAAMKFHGDRAEAFMRTNAPWQDQTGNARNTLSAEAFADDERFTLVLYHQMPYGVWLEVRWSGRYAIILPTLDRVGPEIMATIDGIMARM